MQTETTYLSELEIGTKFQYGNHPDINTLTHKLGENGYSNTTYPFRYLNASGIEMTSTTNLEIKIVK